MSQLINLLSPTGARKIIARSKRNIGYILNQFKSIKAYPDNCTPSMRKEYSNRLSSNFSQLRIVYKAFPDLRPIRVKQLNLFS